MKRTIINILATAAFIGGLVASVLAPWWVVWFIAFPIMYAGGITLIKVNTDFISRFKPDIFVKIFINCVQLIMFDICYSAFC